MKARIYAHTVASSAHPHQVLVLPENRQWSYAQDLLYKHPEGQTDSFILYIKASILLSKVKTYNLRFRWKFFHSPDGAPSSSRRCSTGPCATTRAVSTGR